MDEQDDSIFDGYKAIEEANSDISVEESLEAMRKARLENRGESEPLNLDEDSFASIRPESNSVNKEISAPEKENPDLSEIYSRIRENKKASASSIEMGDAPEDDREDPGFRIYYVDPETGSSHEVPPFTAPEAMVAMIRDEKMADSSKNNGIKVESPDDQANEQYSEQTFDGYQDIQQANSRTTREEELEAMRAARRQNRRDTDEIDETKIGAQRSDE